MTDQEIIDLYWERSEAAITETDLKYGKYCRYIAQHILTSPEDTTECINDTYLNAWISIIRALTDHADITIASLQDELCQDLIVMEITFANGTTAGKGVYRYLFLVKDPASHEWTCVNEGY